MWVYLHITITQRKTLTLIVSTCLVAVNGSDKIFQSQVESYQRLKKWYLMIPCLALSIIRYGSRVKWSNPGKGVAPSPTPWCSSYWKGSLRVTLDYGRQLYLLLSEQAHYLVGRVFSWSERTGFNLRLCGTKHFKMVLDTSLLNTQRYKVRIKGKVEQSREKSIALPYASV